MKKRAWKVVTFGMVFLVAGIFYAWFVEVSGIGIPCPFFAVTGRYCPGCGVTHMCMALLKLDFAAAFESNGMVLILMPVFAPMLIKNVIAYVRTGRYRLSKAEQILVMTAIVLLIGFGIARNLL